MAPAENVQTSKPVFIIAGSEHESAAIPGDVDTTEDVAIQLSSSKPSVREWTLAFLMLGLTVGTTITASQLTNLALTDKTMNFHAPFLFVVFKCLFRTLAFPLYLILNTIIKLIYGRKLDLPRTWRRCRAVCGRDGLTFRIIVVKFFPPMILSLGSQLAYTFALSYLTTSMASALTPPAVATSYLLSWAFLKQRLLTVKVVFVLVTFAGVGLITYHEFVADFSKQTILGIGLMLAQDLCISFYQLVFKKAFPKGDLGQVSFAISTLYTLMFLMYWPVPLVLHLTGVEKYEITKLPYHVLVAAWSCTGVSSLVYGYGIVLAGGFFMGLSDLVVLAANSGIDATLRGVTISNDQIIGTVIVSVAFIMMVLPERYVSIDFKKRFGPRRPQKWRKMDEDSISQSSINSLQLTRKKSRPRLRTTTNELLLSYDILEDRDIMSSEEERATPVVPIMTA